MAINLCITYTEVVAVVGGWILHRQMSSYRSIPWKQWTSAPCGASVHYFQGMERYSDILLYEILKKIWARWKFLWQTGWRTDGRTNYNKNFSEDELKSSLIRAAKVFHVGTGTSMSQAGKARVKMFVSINGCHWQGLENLFILVQKARS